ncbi:MAG: hypothetical protein LBR99_01810, partial [Treponema sp.]|nr:hypothetical protein [Treponema sp.]
MKFAGFLFVYLALCFPFSAYTQTGDELETLLASSQVSQARAARFVLEAADTGSYLEGRDAFNHAFTQKWLPPQAQAEAPVSFGALSLLIMKSFGLKGGLFYSIFKNSHYAYREL